MSDLQASMLSGFRFQSLVSSSLWRISVKCNMFIHEIRGKWSLHYFKNTNERMDVNISYFPMSILRSGPFPRKSSGAALFLLGRMGLVSVGLREINGYSDMKQISHVNPWPKCICYHQNCYCSLVQFIFLCNTFLLQNLGSPHSSKSSSFLLSSECAVDHIVDKIKSDIPMTNFKQPFK